MDYQTTVDRSLKLVPSISYRVKLAREIKKMSQVQLAKAVGISQGTLSDLERGKNRSSLELTKIADVLGVSAIWLSEGRGEMSDRSGSNVININQDKLVPAQKTVPLLDWGDVTKFLLQGDEFVNHEVALIATHLTLEGGFALNVQGDNMEPDFKAGETIIVDQHFKYESGDFVIVIEDKTKPTFKQIINDGSDWLLKPTNPRYPITTLRVDQKVIGVIRAKQKSYR